MELTLKRYRVTGALPLRIGTRYDDGIVNAVLTSTQNQNGNLLVMFRETQVSLLLAPSPSLNTRMLFFRFNPNVLYLLRNRRRGEAYWPQNGGTFGFGWPSRTRVDETIMVLSYQSASGSGPPLPRIDDDWLADADLVRIEAEAIGRTSKRVSVSGFTIEERV